MLFSWLSNLVNPPIRLDESKYFHTESLSSRAEFPARPSLLEDQEKARAALVKRGRNVDLDEDDLRRRLADAVRNGRRAEARNLVRRPEKERAPMRSPATTNDSGSLPHSELQEKHVSGRDAPAVEKVSPATRTAMRAVADPER